MEHYLVGEGDGWRVRFWDRKLSPDNDVSGSSSSVTVDEGGGGLRVSNTSSLPLTSFGWNKVAFAFCGKMSG